MVNIYSKVLLYLLKVVFNMMLGKIKKEEREASCALPRKEYSFSVPEAMIPNNHTNQKATAITILKTNINSQRIQTIRTDNLMKRNILIQISVFSRISRQTGMNRCHRHRRTFSITKNRKMIYRFNPV